MWVKIPVQHARYLSTTPVALARANDGPEVRMPRTRSTAPQKLSHLGVPLFWPMTAALQMAEQGLEVYGKNLEFIAKGSLSWTFANLLLRTVWSDDWSVRHGRRRVLAQKQMAGPGAP